MTVEANPRARALATGNKARARHARAIVADPEHPAGTYTEALEAVDNGRLETTPAAPAPDTAEPEPHGDEQAAPENGPAA